VTAESALENYVKDNIPLEKNHNQACEQLKEVETILSNIANSSNKVNLYFCFLHSNEACCNKLNFSA
jgi:hypothetical protein